MNLKIETSSTIQPQKHVPALDGVRGVAMLLVLLFHGVFMPVRSAADDYFVRIVSAGWCGVDLFFVLSGFLITGILIDAKGGGRYFSSFYGRRLVRIFPLYYFFLIVAFFILPATFGVDETVWRHQAWYWLYLSNILHAVEPAGMSLELSITWTLAVEEQFYLVWPAVVYVCSPRTLARLCFLLIPLVFLGRVAMKAAGVDEGVIYSLTVCRFDTLAVGALVATLVRSPGGAIRWRSPARITFFLCMAICAAIFLIERQFSQYSWLMQSVGYSALSLMFGALIVLVITAAGSSGVVRFWSHPFLRLLGKHSYAMYLIHMPLKRELSAHVFTRAVFDQWPLPAIAVQLIYYVLYLTATLALAIVVWHAIEKPFLRLKRLFPYEVRRPAVKATASGNVETLPAP